MILEKMGYERNEKHETSNIKKQIMEMLAKSKQGIDPSWTEMSIILSNLEKMDHHDFVRTDQLLTREANKKEKEYQWGSIVMNCKWKNL